MRVTLGQLNPTVGDVEGNFQKIKDCLEQAAAEQSELLVMPELFLVGYPPRDLLNYAWLRSRVEEYLEKLCELSKAYPTIGIIIGAPQWEAEGDDHLLFNSALLIYQGSIVFRQHKSLLPTYDVFDETRYFTPARNVAVVPFKGELLGITICEDIWTSEFWPENHYEGDPVKELLNLGASLFINISASPFHLGKDKTRHSIVHGHVQKHGGPFVFVNQIGGNDELVFDGRSMCLDQSGRLIHLGSSFQEEVVTIDVNARGQLGEYSPESPVAQAYQAIVLGLRDYIHKCGFSKVVLGLSGGIDSAVACAVATAALGKENVLGISMPSPYSSLGSVEDSRTLANNLGVDFKVIPIADVFQTYNDVLSEHFRGTEAGIAEENIQARIRGNILMAFSNKFGSMVISTGNKSELAVGYCTLYGDMSGGISVLADVPKTMVYQIADHINRDGEVIPQATIEKAPSAELRPDQKDQDSLPPYDCLDEIINLYVDQGHSIDGIVSRGYDAETVSWVVQAINRSEYKRRQAAPGLKITTKAFGVGRRMPIAAKNET